MILRAVAAPIEVVRARDEFIVLRRGLTAEFTPILIVMELVWPEAPHAEAPERKIRPQAMKMLIDEGVVVL